MVTSKTKKLSFEEIKPTIGKRYSECIESLEFLEEATANELTDYMVQVGILPRFDRNFVHPRLNELVNLNKVKILGKREDLITGKTCAVYKLI